MPYIMAAVVTAVVVLALSLTLPAVLAPWLRGRGFVDVPNSRSSHSTSAVRGLGIAVLVSCVVGTAIISVAAPEARPTIIVVMSGSLAFSVLGATEDFVGLSVRFRVIGQLVCGVATAAALIAGEGWPWFVAVLLGVAVVVYVNATNFMDGLDGVSCLHGLVAGGTFVVVGAIVNQAWLISAGLIVAAAFAGFLPWNVIKRGMFLGDVGSYLLGATVSAVIVAGVVRGVPVPALVGVTAVYLLDVGYTLVVRMHQRQRWYEAHRTHIYQRLSDTGFTHFQVALIITGASLVCAIAGIVIAFGPPLAMVLAGVAIVAVLVAYFFSPRVARLTRPTNES